MTPTKYNNVFAEEADLYRIINSRYHKLHKFVDNVGYYQTVFRINGKRIYVRVHRLIAEALVPNPNNLQGLKSNNYPYIFEYVEECIDHS